MVENWLKCVDYLINNLKRISPVRRVDVENIATQQIRYL